jgi:cobalt-zinc-cadmium resistance protein CzcA
MAFALRARLVVLIATLVLMVAGLLALRRLPIDAMPDVTTVQVQVLTRAPALGSLEVEQFLTRPVESAMSGLPRLDHIRSLSRYGISAVTVVFEDGTDLYFARQLVSQHLRIAEEAIPPGLERPEMGPPSTGLGEVFHFLIEGDGLSPMERRTLLDWDIAYRLRSVPGVVEVNSVGGLVKQYHILVSPSRLLAHRLTLPQVFEAVEKENVIQGGGILERGGEAFLVRGEGMASGASELARVVVGSGPEGASVVVHQIGRAEEGPMLRIGGVTRDGRGEGVVGTTMMLAGANARDVVGRVKREIEEMAPSLPPGVRVVPFYDRQALVSRVIETVSHNLVEGGMLVIAVLLLLLGHLRGGLIVTLAIPLSMLFAFLGMLAAGISGNLMSLGAIDFGLIVDGSVVMVENIVFRLASRPGLEPAERRQEVAQAALEVGRPVAFGVGIILIVYLPILTLGGIEGKMFRPMAWTVVFAVAGSLLLALTLVPVLCSLTFGAVREKETWLLRRAHRLHGPLVRRAMASPRATAAVAGGVFTLSLGAAALLGAEFIPQLDEGDLLLRVSRLPSAALSEALRSTTEVEKVLHRFPEVNTAVSRTGSPELATEPEGFDLSEVFINLKPPKEWARGRDRDELIEEMQAALEKAIPGQIFSFSQPIEDRFEDLVAGVKSDVGVKVFGEDLGVLAAQAREIAGIVSQVRGAADTRVEQTAGLPMVRVKVDRDRLARFGVHAKDALAAVEAARSGRVVGNIFEGRRRFDVVVRLDESVAADPQALGSVPLLAADGRPVALSQVANISVEEGPSRISREQGERRVVVEANVRGRDLAGFVSEARRAVQARVKLPTGYYLRWSGQFEQLAAATERLMIAVPAALLLIFGLLYGAFGSARAALLIFLNVPMAATGGIFALLLRGMPFSISAGVGFIALFGVAVLNGVVLVSFIRRLETEGMPAGEAAERAARARLRPVLMTALVASLGFVPMAIATGSGAEVQKPLATVVIGGLVTSTLLTLVVLPAVYRWFATQQEGRR